MGATASVLKRVPFLRLLYLFGCVDVSSKTLSETLKEGYCVGLVSDGEKVNLSCFSDMNRISINSGIAGIFKCSKNEETLYLANRKSLAKFCLKNGCPLIPAYIYCFSSSAPADSSPSDSLSETQKRSASGSTASGFSNGCLAR
eukprot:751401-Hanusia_phi.AAC.2